MRYRAIFIAAPSVLAAACVHGWLDAGHEITDCWENRRPGRTDRRLRWLRPRLSASAATARAGVVCELCTGAGHQQRIADRIRRDRPDIVIIAGFPQRIGEAILSALPGRVVNLHPALLPHYRGPHPTEAMLIDGTMNRHGGATLHLVDADFDTGPIIAARPTRPITDMNPVRYRIAAAAVAGGLVRDALPAFLAGRMPLTPQDEANASYRRVDAADRTLRPEMPTADILRLARMLPLTGGAWLETPGGPVRIAGVRSTSRRSGAPLSLGRATASFDTGDCRITVRRHGPIADMQLKLRKQVLMLSA